MIQTYPVFRVPFAVHLLFVMRFARRLWVTLG